MTNTSVGNGENAVAKKKKVLETTSSPPGNLQELLNRAQLVEGLPIAPPQGLTLEVVRYKVEVSWERLRLTRESDGEVFYYRRGN